MNYLRFPLHHQTAGTIITIQLRGVESDVLLVDTLNLSRFQRGDSFRYHGGHYRRSPVRLTVPTTGEWTAVVIRVGGRVEASVSTISAA